MKIFVALVTALAFATLLNADTDPNAKDEWGNTLLHRAAEGSDTEAVAELLAAGADVYPFAYYTGDLAIARV